MRACLEDLGSAVLAVGLEILLEEGGEFDKGAIVVFLVVPSILRHENG